VGRRSRVAAAFGHALLPRRCSGGDGRAGGDLLQGALLLVCSDALQAQGLAGVELIPACTGRGGAVQFMARACSPNWRVLVY